MFTSEAFHCEGSFKLWSKSDFTWHPSSMGLSWPSIGNKACPIGVKGLDGICVSMVPCVDKLEPSFMAKLVTSCPSPEPDGTLPQLWSGNVFPANCHYGTIKKNYNNQILILIIKKNKTKNKQNSHD